MKRTVFFPLLAVAGMLVGSGGAVSAATVTLDAQAFSGSAYPTSGVAARADALKSVNVLAVEDFEHQGAVREFVTNKNKVISRKKLDTGSVGGFAMTGANGSGGTVKNPSLNQLLNRGVGAYLRGRNTYGRANTTPGGHFFLDSNDVQNMGWNVALAGGRMFDTLVFNIMDAADTGSTFSILVDGVRYFSTSKRTNGEVNLVKIVFDQPISFTTIQFQNTRHNDGFGIDDISVGMSAVPLPAGGMLLLVSLTCLAALRRRPVRAEQAA